MLDTLGFRLHGIKAVKDTWQAERAHAKGEAPIFLLPTHAELFRKMNSYKGKYFSSAVRYQKHEWTVGDVKDDDEYHALKYMVDKTEHLLIRDMIIFNDEGRTKKIFAKVNGKWEVPSSYHGVTFNINPEQGYIDFQMSVPKYLYGNSLAQYVPNVHSKYYKSHYDELNSLGSQSKILHKRLIKFVKKFFQDLTYFFSLEGDINLGFVELTRIDLCFNQYFKDRETALAYLENLKVLNYKRHGKGQSDVSGFNTSLTRMVSDGSYFKIYHKGSEYRDSAHGDFKKHTVINQKYMDSLQFNEKYKPIYHQNRELISSIFEKATDGSYNMPKDKLKEVSELVNKIYKKVPFKTEFFKSEMDKVLRYEVSLKGKWLSYVYKRKVFRRNCPVHNRSFADYLATKSIYDSRNTEKSKRKVSKYHNRNYKMFNKFLNRKIALILGGGRQLERFLENGTIDLDNNGQNYNITRYEFSRTHLSTTDVGIFDTRMVQFCVKHFYKLLREYQVKRLTDYRSTVEKIKSYNDEVAQRVEKYNRNNHWRTLDAFNNPRYIKGKKITKATQMLTQKELVEKRLKRISPLILLTIMKLLKAGKSFRMIREEMGISPSQFSRYKKDLEYFNVTEHTMVHAEEIETCIDFSHYYQLCKTLRYKENCFLNEKTLQYG